MRLFSASWCGPCKTVKQYIADNKIAGVTILDADTEEHKDEFRKLGIRGIPVLETPDGTLMRESTDIIKYLGGL